MSAVPTSSLTPEEYLALERQAETRSEYFAGEMFAMSGASRQHGRIVFNIASQLGGQLRDRPCDAFISEMRVKVSPTGLYTYPDVVVACEEPQFEDTQLDTLLNPTAIIEVLSPSTEGYDRGEKFAHYRSLSSLREYVLISQARVRVERFVRQGNDWILRETAGLEGVVRLEAIGCELTLRDVYHRVELPNGGELGGPGTISPLR